MTQLRYWAMFGINKKMIVGFILLNVIVFGSIGYFGINIDQQQKRDIGTETIMQPENHLSTDQGDIFWVTTQIAFRYAKNGSTIGFVQHVLHRMTSSQKMMEYILYNGTRENQRPTLEQIIGDNIYINMSPGNLVNLTNDLLVKLTISQLPVANNGTFYDVPGRIAVIARDNSSDHIRLYKSGAIIRRAGEINRFPQANLYTGLRIFYLSDLNFGEYHFPIQGQAYFAQGFKNIFGVETFDPTVQAPLYQFSVKEFYDFTVDKDNNLIIRGQSEVLTANLDKYNESDNTTANYIQIPLVFQNNSFVRWYDDGNDFYMLFWYLTFSPIQELYNVTLGDGTRHSGENVGTNEYTIMAVQGFQNTINGQVFTTTAGIQTHMFLRSNATNFEFTQIINGVFYGGYTAYFYNGKPYSPSELLLPRNKGYGDIVYFSSIFLFSASIDSMLTSTLSNANSHLIWGKDLINLPDGGWVENGKLQGMAFKLNNGQVDSIVYFIVQREKNNKEINFSLETQEGIL